MAEYVIKEVSYVGSDRKATMIVNGSLVSAKRCASRAQRKKGTVMKIEGMRGELIAYKKNGEWFNCSSNWD